MESTDVGRRRQQQGKDSLSLSPAAAAAAITKEEPKGGKEGGRKQFFPLFTSVLKEGGKTSLTPSYEGGSAWQPIQVILIAGGGGGGKAKRSLFPPLASSTDRTYVRTYVRPRLSS